jgi:hypothetical protein
MAVVDVVVVVGEPLNSHWKTVRVVRQSALDERRRMKDRTPSLRSVVIEYPGRHEVAL